MGEVPLRRFSFEYGMGDGPDFGSGVDAKETDDSPFMADLFEGRDYYERVPYQLTKPGSIFCRTRTKPSKFCDTVIRIALKPCTRSNACVSHQL